MCSVVEKIFTASLATVGAFIPILGLMLVHYLIRRGVYRDKRERLTQLRDMSGKLADLNDVYIEGVYRGLGVRDYGEFLIKAINNPALIKSINRELDMKTKNLKNSNELSLDIGYIERYSFRVYLSALLDKRFPDRYFD